MQTIRITITSEKPANIHIKECKPEERDVKEKLGNFLKQLDKPLQLEVGSHEN